MINVRMKYLALYVVVLTLIIGVFGSFALTKAHAAENAYHYAALDDYDEVLTDEEEQEVFDVLSKAADESGYNIGVVITNDLKGLTSREYAENYLDMNFGVSSDSVVLMILNTHDKPEYSSDRYTDWISVSGKASGKLNSKIDVMFNNFYDILGRSGYATAFGTFANDVAEYSGNGSAVTVVEAGEYSVALDDYDECLTDSEEAAVLESLRSAAKSAECHVGIVITRDLDGLSDEKYAGKYLDKTFGTGSTAVVLMLLNTHDNPEYSSYTDCIRTSGEGHDKYDKKVDKMFDMVYDELEKSDGSFDFYNGCLAFCAAVTRYGNGEGSYSVKYTAMDAEGFLSANFGRILFAVIAAVIVSCCVVGGTVTGYRKKKPLSASAYLDTRQTRITNSVDRFIREYTTSVHLSSSSSGGHSGGHHGGGGGGHHSGGHGGGHGHHR